MWPHVKKRFGTGVTYTCAFLAVKQISPDLSKINSCLSQYLDHNSKMGQLILTLLVLSKLVFVMFLTFGIHWQTLTIIVWKLEESYEKNDDSFKFHVIFGTSMLEKMCLSQNVKPTFPVIWSFLFKDNALLTMFSLALDYTGNCVFGEQISACQGQHCPKVFFIVINIAYQWQTNWIGNNEKRSFTDAFAFFLISSFRSFLSISISMVQVRTPLGGG